MVTSKFQSATRERLQLLLRDFEVRENYRPDWMKNPKTGKNLELDFFFPLVNIAVEVQGEQHTRYIPGLHRSQADFEAQKERDAIKRQLCANMGIALYEVYKLEDIEDFIYSMRGHCKEMSQQLGRKVTALKTLEYYSAELIRIRRNKNIPKDRSAKLVARILHICEKYNIPIENVKPNMELTKLDVAYAVKPKVLLIWKSASGKEFTERAALVRFEDGLAHVVYMDKKGTDFHLHFNPETGEEVKGKDSQIDWRLDLSTLPTKQEIKDAADDEKEYEVL